MRRATPWHLWEVACVFVVLYAAGWLYHEFSGVIEVLITTPASLPFQAALSSGLHQFVLFLAVTLVVVIVHGNPWEALGFRRGEKLWLGAACGCGIFVAVNLADRLVGAVTGVRQTVHPLGISLSQGAGLINFLYPLVIGSLLIPFGEELYFRAFTLPPLERLVRNDWAAITLGAVFFAAVRLNPWSAVSWFIAGFILGWLYRRTGSLWVSMTAHGTWMALVALAIHLSLV